MEPTRLSNRALAALCLACAFFGATTTRVSLVCAQASPPQNGTWIEADPVHTQVMVGDDGQTYVATTVLVHYANAWRDHLAATTGDATKDPFRITVLAPNSVVSTWRREITMSISRAPAATLSPISAILRR